MKKLFKKNNYIYEVYINIGGRGCWLDIILWYILAGLCVYFVLHWLAKIFGFYWRAGYNKRQEKRKQKRIEKQKWKFVNVNIKNPLLKQITKARFIVLKGIWGAGKSILMNVIAHFLFTNIERHNKKNKRYQKSMNPDYFKQYLDLQKQGKLPVYSNLDFVYSDKKGKLKKQDIVPFITLQKKAIYKAIFAIDEISSLFPKEMYQEQQANPDPIVEEMKELFKKFRHYTDGWILATEQDGEDIYKGFRKNGYALVTAKQTIVKINLKGKIVRFLSNLRQFILPAYMTTNVRELMAEQLFVGDKFKTFLKSLFPAYYLLPRQYYITKQQISNKAKQKYQEFLTLLEFEGQDYYLRYTNADIFAYDTRAYKNEYSAKFDKTGNRKVVVNG